MPPLYPYEDRYTFDEDTNKALSQIQSTIPDKNRGDNDAFDKYLSGVKERAQVASAVGKNIQQAVGNTKLSSDHGFLDTLNRNGIKEFDEMKLSSDEIDDVMNYLNQQSVYPSHVAHFALRKPHDFQWVKQRETFGSYDLETIMQAPHVIRYMADPRLIGLVSDYFGCLPTISSTNIFWSFPSKKKVTRGTQNFHRDVVDYRTFKLFICLTETTPNDGAHVYIEKTHTYEAISGIFDDQKNDTLPEDLNPFDHRLRPEDLFHLPLDGYGYDKLYEHFFKDQIKIFSGECGTVVCEDNFGIHRGIPPRARDRLMMWVAFSLTSADTYAAQVKLQKRIPYAKIKDKVDDSKENRYVLRNIIDFK